MTARFLVVAIACLLAGPAQPPTFKARVESVRVDVLVTRDGKPLTDLRPADFEVLDNGAPQQIDHAAFEEIPLNVVFVLDASSSVEGDRARRLNAACLNVLSDLTRKDRAGLVVFGSPVMIRAALTHDMASVGAALSQPGRLGETSLADAAHVGMLQAESAPGRALVILFSDAIEVSSFLSYGDVIETARRSDTVLYGVSLKGVPKPHFVRDLAETSGGDYFEIAAAQDIEAAFRKILDEFRHRYLLSYTLTGVERAGWHRLQVKVKQRGASVKARPGYFRE